MQNITGKPETMKKININLIYKAIIELKSATKAELSNKTKISITTIRSLIEELLRNNEIIELSLDKSSGGRCAQRYILNTEKNLIMSIYSENNNIIYQINNLYGDIVYSNISEINNNNILDSISELINKCKKKWNICSIGLGVSGIVENNKYHIYYGHNEWETINIGKQIQELFDIPVILENDINAILHGFAIDYVKNNKDYDISNTNMVYIHFNKSCTGAGIMSNGKIIHGANNFAGEIGFIPLENNKTLDNILQNTNDKNIIINTIKKVISIINCVTNPSLIIIGGNLFENEILDIEKLKEHENNIYNLLYPDIKFINDYKNSYLLGLYNLTFQKIISNILD